MDKPKYPGVYKITNRVNGKVYIGEAINIYLRWIEHRCRLRNNYSESKYLQRAWNKYGEESFSFDVLEKCDVPELRRRENFWATKLKSHNRKHGYNLRLTDDETKGKLPPETVKKIAEKNRGRKHTEERNKRISASKTGIPRDKETKEKLSEYWKARYNEEGGSINPMFGRKHTNDTKQKMSKFASERKHLPRKKVIITDIENGTKDEVFLKDALKIYSTSLYNWSKSGREIRGKTFSITNI